MATNEELLRASDRAASTLLVIENAAHEDTALLTRFLAELAVLADALWPGDDAPVAERAVVGLRLARELDRATAFDAALDAILAALDKAGQRGADTAEKMARLIGRRVSPRIDVGGTQRAVETTAAQMRSQLSVARSLVLRALTQTELRDGVKLATAVGPRTESLMRWSVQDAYHQSLSNTAIQDDRIKLVWRAERDACLSCLSYSGQITVPGKGYPKGLMFGDTALKASGLVTPPLHPRCRCEQILWERGANDSPITLPQALKREAQRSVLRGWADASGPAKGRAARRLLDQGVQAPASVLAAAKRIALRFGA